MIPESNSRRGNGFSRFLRRVIGAMMLDPRAYEDVEADQGATAAALLVILLASVAAGIGASGYRAQGGGIVALAAAAGIIALLAWTSWALVTFEIGVRLLPERQTRADVGELLRTLGFSTAPALFLVFGLVRGLTTPVFATVSVWLLASMVMAVRQALDYTHTLRAIGVCVIGWLLALGIVVIIGLFFAPIVSGA